jgi:hypothetical protein
MPLDKDREYAEAPVREVKFSDDPVMDVEGVSSTVTDVSLTVDDSKNGGAKVKAARFVDLLKDGVKPGEAAERIGTSLKQLRTSEDMKTAVAELLATATLSSEIRKGMVRAGLNKVFIEGISSEDPKDRKVALEAAKLIASDEGLQTGSDVTVAFDLGDLGDVIKDVKLDFKPSN